MYNTTLYQRKNTANTVIDINIDQQPEMTTGYSISDYAKVGLALVGTIGAVALANRTGFLPSSWWGSDTAPNNILDNSYPLSIQEPITFADNSLPIQPRHTKRVFGGEFQINTYTASNQEEPSVAALSSNDFVVVWQSDGQDGDNFGIYGQRFSSIGVPQGGEFQINTYTTSWQTYPSVAGLNMGGFVVVWQSDGQDGDGSGIYGQRYLSTGIPQGSEFQISTYTASIQGYPSVAALTTGDFVVTWTSLGQDGDLYGIYGQRYSNTGVPQGVEFQINTYTTNHQVVSSVVSLNTGDFVVTWASVGQDGGLAGIYGQRYSSTGVPQGSEFQINTYTISDQLRPVITAFSTGDFVVAWGSDGQDGANLGIYGQRYSSTGIPQGSEFQINTYTASGQGYSSIAALTTGDFVVVWESNGQDSDGYGIYGQRFSDTAIPQGSEFQSNTYTMSDQLRPVITAFSTGDFVVVWSSNGQDGDLGGIYGRIYFNVNMPPELINNAITINEAETIILNTSKLSAYDPDDVSADLIFNISNLQYGQFERVSNPGVAITSFIQQEIIDRAIQFVHDVSENKPAYDVSVSDGILSTAISSANITFVSVNSAPTLINNTLTVNEGQTVVLTTTNLSVTDSDNTPPELTFTVSNVQHGQFERISNPSVVITSFTQQEIIDRAIQFIHDGGEIVPIYDVSVSDGLLSSGISSANIIFSNNVNDAPVVINNALIASKGEAIILSASNLNATDVDNSDAGLTFTANNVLHGQFETASNVGVLITSFMQQDITDGVIRFVHDGSGSKPSYDISASDGLETSPSEPVAIVYIAQNQLVTKPGDTIVLSSKQLAIQSQISQAMLEISLSNIQYARFEKNINPGVAIASFTLAELNSGAIQFIHSGTENVPQFTMHFKDIAKDHTFFRQIIGNALLNHQPIVLNPIGTLNWPLNKETSYPIPSTLFTEPDGQQLQLFIKEFNGNALPQWVTFNNSTNILIGTPRTPGSYDFKIIAKDPYDEVAEDRFYIDVKATTNGTTTIIGEGTNPVPIIAAIAGGAVLLAASVAAGILYFKKAQDRKTRQQHQFARKIRHHLGIQKVDNFDSEQGQSFVQAVQSLSGFLHEVQGIDITNMDDNRLDELAGNIATAAKNKINPATVGLWKKSAITIQEFADNIEQIARDNRLDDISYAEVSDDTSTPMQSM